jgi:ferrochelatase
MALVERLGISGLDSIVCYQSRVGPLRWIGPPTDQEIRRAGSEGLGLVVAPIAFVSEHSETLVELDMDYAKLAEESGVPHYLRAPTVGVRSAFIEGLADLALRAGAGRYCPAAFACCGFREATR